MKANISRDFKGDVLAKGYIPDSSIGDIEELTDHILTMNIEHLSITKEGQYFKINLNKDLILVDDKG